jgi:hypothetical protein
MDLLVFFREAAPRPRHNVKKNLIPPGGTAAFCGLVAGVILFVPACGRCLA